MYGKMKRRKSRQRRWLFCKKQRQEFLDGWQEPVRALPGKKFYAGSLAFSAFLIIRSVKIAFGKPIMNLFHDDKFVRAA
jgi:hypothetical protein